MRLIQIKKSRRSSYATGAAEPLSLDPRDPDIIRAREAQRRSDAKTRPTPQRKEKQHVAP